MNRIWQMDVKTMFLKDSFREDIYMEQTNGFIAKNQKHMICRLKKAIYGLMRASKSWNIRFDQAIKSFGL